MNLFCDDLERFGAAPALLSSHSGTGLTYAQLAARVATIKKQLGKSRKLVFVKGLNSVETVCHYLACLQARHPVYLFDGAKPEATQRLISIYNPHIVIEADAPTPITVRHTETCPLHADLALLLSTSGSTGTPKFVRLSLANIASNAASIAEYLDIQPADRTLAHLKLHYSYGLSVLNSHLAAGAAVCLTESSVVNPDFWNTLKNQAITSFAGVPYTFTSIDARGENLAAYPALRYLTQAGGKMQPADVVRWAAQCSALGIRFIVMYGQTEAAPRISYLPAEWVAKYPESIGVAIPGGKLELFSG